MSSYGRYTLRLSPEQMAELRRQQEEARRQRLRQECAQLLADLRQKSQSCQHHLTHVFARQAHQEAQDLARQAHELLQAAPDQAVQLARQSVAALQRGLQTASRQAAAWTADKTEAHQAVTVLRLAADHVLHGASVIDGGDPLLAQLTAALEQAEAALRREDFARARAAASRGQEASLRIEQQRQQAQEQEAVRRQIVQGLRRVLVRMGFTVESPIKQGDKVILVGQLPSGRTAWFAIAPDASLDYDFNGYERRLCAKDDQAIRRQLEQDLQFRISGRAEYLKDEQPLQIGSSALDLPGGLNQRSY